MRIVGYLSTSLIEWPGKITAVVFVPGCNFRCPFCYNRDLVLNPEKLPRIPEKEILLDLAKRKKWVDGVVITGGEPLLLLDLPEFLKKIKNLNFLTRIYTNGSNSKLLKQLLAKRLVDAITMDIKGPLDRRYSKSIGVSFDLGEIFKSIQLVLESGIESQFVTTVIPKLHKKQDLVDLAKELAELIKKSKKNEEKLFWCFRRFQPKDTCIDPKFSKIRPYSPKEMKSFIRAVRKVIPKAELKVS